MKVTRKQAIKIIERFTDTENYDWVDTMDDFGLYNEEEDTWATIYDVFEALGVSREELN